MTIFIILLIVLLIAFTRPWIDFNKGIILWYTNFITGERKYVKIGGQD